MVITLRRVGVVYAHGSRTVIRAGIGLYFDRIPLRATSNALQRDGTKYLVVQFHQLRQGRLCFRTCSPLNQRRCTKPNITRIDPLIEDGTATRLIFRSSMLSRTAPWFQWATNTCADAILFCSGT